MTTPCDKCGHEIALGEHPFCPHGFGIKGLSIVGDEIDETIENFAPTPMHFTSRAEKRRYMKENGIHEKVRHVGNSEGGDRSIHTQRWI